MEIYLDANATTPVLPAAQAAALVCMGERFGNPSSTHATGLRARAVLDETRARARRLLGAPTGQLLFTSGATEGIQTAVLSALSSLRGRDDVDCLLYGATEHKAVPAALREPLVADASGDRLDAVLCLMQAAWASTRPGWGLPAQVDPLEAILVESVVAIVEQGAGPTLAPLTQPTGRATVTRGLRFVQRVAGGGVYIGIGQAQAVGVTHAPVELRLGTAKTRAVGVAGDVLVVAQRRADHVGDFVIEVRTVGAGANAAIVSGHRGSPRRALEASPLAIYPSRQNPSALSL